MIKNTILFNTIRPLCPNHNETNARTRAASEGNTAIIKLILETNPDLDKKYDFIQHYSSPDMISVENMKYFIQTVAKSDKVLSLETEDNILCISQLLHGITYFCKDEGFAYEGFEHFIKYKDTTGNPIIQIISFNPLYQNKLWTLDLHGYISITTKFAIRYCLESVKINNKNFDNDEKVNTLTIITG